MRTLAVALVALIGGFLAGIALSEFIGITGFLLFDRAVGLRFLPIYLAVMFAGAALVVDLLRRRRAS
jgi:hypothetical protein